MQSNAHCSAKTLPDVGALFKSFRKAAGKTQVQLAAITGIRQEAISRFEAGTATDFSLGRLLMLLQSLGLELDFKSTGRRPTLDDLLTERRGDSSDEKARP